MPGRCGAVLLGGEVGARVIRVRLYWDFLRDCDEAARADVRHAVYAALLRPGGGVLVLPGDPCVSYRDAVCTGCGSWSSLFADGSAEIEFTAFDPVGFGASRSSEACEFVVGGSWPTFPVVEMTACAGKGVSVALRRFAAVSELALGPTSSIPASSNVGSIPASDGAGTVPEVVVEREFVGGEAISLDFEREVCLVDGADASDCVSLESGFFPLSPGVCEVGFSGCSAHSVSWVERWL